MSNRQFSQLVVFVLVAAGLGLTTACWKSEEPEPSAAVDSVEPPVDLGREDIAALPGADVDLELLDQFPYYLRQQSSMAPNEIFAYYDDFFGDHGWSVEASTDPITEGQIHIYRLGNEMAFVTVSATGNNRSEVVLSRRQARDDEISDNRSD